MRGVRSVPHHAGFAPASQQFGEVRGVDHAVAVEVRRTVGQFIKSSDSSQGCVGSQVSVQASYQNALPN
jgi:hypothetical protein